jgi:hypothetical protein
VGEKGVVTIQYVVNVMKTLFVGHVTVK